MTGIQATTRFYRAYGFVMKSAFELPYPEIDPVDEPDVIIREDDVPATLDNCAVRHGIWQAGPMEFLLTEDTVGRVLVRGGSEILVQKLDGVDPRWVSVFINGSALAALLQQRGSLPLHASAVCMAGQAILFAGASGAGKSTLCATMRDRGYGLLAEDVSAIRLDSTQTPHIDPASGHLRLWKDATQKLGYDVKGKRLAANEFQKFEFPVNLASDSAVPVYTIYFLKPEIRADIQIEPLSRLDAFQSVYNRSYRRRFHAGQGLQQQHFKLVSTVTNAVQLKLILRPSQNCDPADVADMVEQDLAAQAAQSVLSGAT